MEPDTLTKLDLFSWAERLGGWAVVIFVVKWLTGNVTNALELMREEIRRAREDENPELREMRQALTIIKNELTLQRQFREQKKLDE